MPEETPKTFKEIVQDFIDELNQALEDSAYDDSIMDNLNDIFELLDVTVNHL